MPNFYPSDFDKDFTPLGEQRFWEWLKRLPSDWHVIHNIDLTRINDGKKTQIDFLVINPNKGMVAVEVKSHNEITLVNSKWRLGSKEYHRSPLEQSDDGLHTLLRHIQKEFGSEHALSRCPKIRLACFPFSTFDYSDHASFKRREIIDLNNMNLIDDDRKMKSYFDDYISWSFRENNHSEIKNSLIIDDVQNLVEFLKGSYGNAPGRRSRVNQSRNNLENYLKKNQKPVLTLVANNPRLIVKGPAGTGKTQIATGLAKIFAEQNKSIGFFCHNKLIGNLISEELSCHSKIVAGPFRSKLMRLLDIGQPSQASENWFNDGLFDVANKKLQDPSLLEKAKFEVLIIDEAQDIIQNKKLMEVAWKLLEGGKEKGNWFVFGDFDNQVLSFDESQNVKNDFDNLKNHAAVFSLNINCRNFKEVGTMACFVASLKTDAIYADFYKGNGGPQKAQPIFYNNTDDQLNKLKIILTDLLAPSNVVKYSPEDIVLLTFRAASDGIANNLMTNPNYTWGCVNLSDLENFKLRKNRLSLGSVYQFKGLESKIVIVTDVDSRYFLNNLQQLKNLGYTGLTRALEVAYVLIENGTRKNINLG